MMVGRAAAFLLLSSSAMHAQESELDLTLPTANTALYRGGGPAFYQFTDRTFRGVKSTPWEAGRYGFVRDPDETTGVVYRRFHEGIDIKPLERSAQGVPLDAIMAVADGRVVYVNRRPGASNYGIYVVIEHNWGGSPYYSLYAHLAKTAAEVDATVAKGAEIGVLGSTGRGIDQRRAHLHFEINLMLSHSFERWHQKYFPTEKNHHGLYSGLNLAGIDVAALFLELRHNPVLTITEFISREKPAYKIAIPATAEFVLPKLYPWMITSAEPASAWQISFARSGLPLRIEPLQSSVAAPVASWVAGTELPLHVFTKGVISGRPGNFRLTAAGLRYAYLFAGPRE